MSGAYGTAKSYAGLRTHYHNDCQTQHVENEATGQSKATACQLEAQDAARELTAKDDMFRQSIEQAHTYGVADKWMHQVPRSWHKKR
jgi:hypothetical protein